MEQDNVVLNINSKYKQELDEDDVIVTEKQIQDNAKITFYSLLDNKTGDVQKENLRKIITTFHLLTMLKLIKKKKSKISLKMKTLRLLVSF